MQNQVRNYSAGNGLVFTHCFIFNFYTFGVGLFAVGLNRSLLSRVDHWLVCGPWGPPL